MSLRRRQVGSAGLHCGTGTVVAAALLAASVIAVLPAWAQYPGQISDKNKNAPTMRAVAVLEFTGDLAHPKASRLIPISVWDGQQLQEGDIYLARPQPLALDSETEYELQKDGTNIGFFDVRDAARQQDSWIGLGAFKPLPTGPTPQQLAVARRQQRVDMDDAESDTPILHRKHHAGDPDNNSGTAGGGNSGAALGPAAPRCTKVVRRAQTRTTIRLLRRPILIGRVCTRIRTIRPAPLRLRHRPIRTGPGCTRPRPTNRRM